jgi:hypothetical protein
MKHVSLLLPLLFAAASFASAGELAVPDAGFIVTVPEGVQLVQRADLAAQEPSRVLPANFCFPRFRVGGVWFSSLIARMGDHETMQRWTERHLQRQQLNPDTMDYRAQKVEPFKSASGVEGFLCTYESKPRKAGCWGRHCGVVFTNRRAEVVCVSATMGAAGCGKPTDLDKSVFASLRLE